MKTHVRIQNVMLGVGVDNIGKTHISAERELHFPIYLIKETVNAIKVKSGLEKKPTNRLLLGMYKDMPADIPGIREPRPAMYLNSAKGSKCQT